MMRSLYSGVSGLNNHQTRMDVIGNNVSNVNTIGYKKGRVTFQDLFSQTMTGASRPTETMGGTNPQQIGLGMTVAAIDTIHTQGSLQSTGVNTDMSILGNGFFIEKIGTDISYSRNGAFSLDATGMLVNPANGKKVQGYGTIKDATGATVINQQSGLSDIFVPLGEKSPAEATSLVKFRSNLSSLTPVVPANATPEGTAAGTWRTSIDVVDSEGNKQELQLNFTKALDANGVAVPNVWNAQVNILDKSGRAVNNITVNSNVAGANNNNQFTITFNTAGSIIGIQDGFNNAVPQGQEFPTGNKITANLNYTVAGVNPQNVSLDLGESGLYSGITQFASASSTKAYFQNGLEMGYLQSFTIDNTGTIMGSYTNSAKKPLGQVGLATFSNPGGLSKVGETSFVDTPNSGQAIVSPPQSQSAGSIKAGTLEMSNVDLANEFTDMIVTQRGFQANSRTITTSDSMLEELLRLKR